MYHIVYLTTNLVNQKIYIGVRSTYNLDDGYIGSGIKLKLALKKHGKHNFNRQILYYCLEAEDAYYIESQIVNELFINRRDTYNCCIGGKGGNITNMKGKTLEQLYGNEKATYMKEHQSKMKKGIPINRSKEQSKAIGKIVSLHLSGKNYQEIHGNEKAKILIDKKIQQGLTNNPFKGKHHSHKTKQILADKQSDKVGYFKNNRLYLIEVSYFNISYTFLHGLYELAKFINISEYYIRKCMKTNITYKGFAFKML